MASKGPQDGPTPSYYRHSDGNATERKLSHLIAIHNCLKASVSIRGQKYRYMRQYKVKIQCDKSLNKDKRVGMAAFFMRIKNKTFNADARVARLTSCNSAIRAYN